MRPNCALYSSSAAAELWDVERHGRCRRIDQLMLPLYSHTEGMRVGGMVRTPVGLSWPPLQALFIPQTPKLSYTLPGLPKPAPSGPSELSPLHTACGVGDHAGEACQTSPPSSVSLPAIRQIILEAPAYLGQQQGDRPSCPEADTSRSAHPRSPSRKLLIKLPARMKWEKRQALPAAGDMGVPRHPTFLPPISTPSCRHLPQVRSTRIRTILQLLLQQAAKATSVKRSLASTCPRASLAFFTNHAARDSRL